MRKSPRVGEYCQELEKGGYACIHTVVLIIQHSMGQQIMSDYEGCQTVCFQDET